jgi:hypothetical protein
MPSTLREELFECKPFSVPACFFADGFMQKFHRVGKMIHRSPIRKNKFLFSRAFIDRLLPFMHPLMKA